MHIISNNTTKKLIIQCLKKHHGIQLSVKDLIKIKVGSDNLLYEYKKEFIIKIYTEYSIESIEKSCELLDRYNNQKIVVADKKGSLVTNLKDKKIVLLKYIEGTQLECFNNEINLNILIDLPKKIKDCKLNIVSSYFVDKKNKKRFVLLLNSQNIFSLKYLTKISDLYHKLNVLDFSFLNKESMTSCHHDVKPDNIIISDGHAILLDWDKACNAYFIDELCRTTFFAAETTDSINFKIVERFYSRYQKEYSREIFYKTLFLVITDIFSEIMYSATMMPNAKEYLATINEKMYPDSLYSKALLVWKKI